MINCLAIAIMLLALAIIWPVPQVKMIFAVAAIMLSTYVWVTWAMGG